MGFEFFYVFFAEEFHGQPKIRFNKLITLVHLLKHQQSELGPSMAKKSMLPSRACFPW